MVRHRFAISNSSQRPQRFPICHTRAIRLHSRHRSLLPQQTATLTERKEMKKILCLVSYWLILLAPVALILASMPQKRRLIVAIPVGAVLAWFGERGLKKWKQLWRIW